MLHFRHFLIPALLVGAALFLPDNAFAEKNEVSGQANSHKELVQTNNPSEQAGKAVKQANVPAKAEDAKQVAKTVVVPEPASKSQSQSGVKQQVSHNEPKQVVSQKPAVAVPEKSLPVQAKGNGYGLSNNQKIEKTVNPPGQEKSTAVQESKQELGMNELSTTDGAEHFSKMATVENKTKSTKLVYEVEPRGQGSDLSKPQDAEQSEPVVTVPPEKEKIPSSKEEIPNVDQAINPTQRSNGASGQSNDRVSQGLNTISQLDKWFEWNTYYEIKLVQPFLSGCAFLSNQWVNAPPSPPPQEAPLLKTVTRSY